MLFSATVPVGRLTDLSGQDEILSHKTLSVVVPVYFNEGSLPHLDLVQPADQSVVIAGRT